MTPAEQAYAVILMFAAIAIIPAGTITALFGGRGVLYTSAAITLAATCYVGYFLLTVTASTGMEGLILLYVPILLVGIYFGAFLGWGIVRLFKPA